MAKPKNLNLGWESKNWIRFEDTGFYPEDVVLDIASRFDIDTCLDYQAPAWKLKQRLETAGTLYIALKHNSDAPSGKQIRTYFDALRRGSRELIELIQNANAVADQILGSTTFDMTMAELRGKDGPLVAAGVIRKKNQDDDRKYEAEFSELSDIVQHLKFLEIVAEACEKKVPTPPRGRKRNEALYYWVLNMVRYWQEDLGREFTSTSFAGLPTSYTGQFLEAALFPMDAEAIGGLAHQMWEVKND